MDSGSSAATFVVIVPNADQDAEKEGPFKSTATLLYNLNDFDALKMHTGQSHYSAPVYVRGVKWCVGIKSSLTRRSAAATSSINVTFYLCASLSKTNAQCSVNCIVSARIISRQEGVPDLLPPNLSIRDLSKVYDAVHKRGAFMRWQFETLKNPSYCTGNSITVEVTFKADPLSPVDPEKPIELGPIYDFASPPSSPSNELYSDLVLVVEGRRLYVSKGYLAVYSQYFSRMFTSDFAERNRGEIPLNDVNYDEFYELLDAIYPGCAAIKARNVAAIIKLADRFLIPQLTHRCEHYLLDNDKVTLSEKLLYCQKYQGLGKLKRRSLSKVCTYPAFKKLRLEQSYAELDNETKVALVENLR